MSDMDKGQDYTVDEGCAGRGRGRGAEAEGQRQRGAEAELDPPVK